MPDRSALQRVAVGVLATVSTGGALLGLAGTASASPVPGTPFTPVSNCVDNGGTVTETVPGVQRCSGGGDTGDVIISEDQAKQLAQTVPPPPIPGPALPDF